MVLQPGDLSEVSEHQLRQVKVMMHSLKHCGELTETSFIPEYFCRSSLDGFAGRNAEYDEYTQESRNNSASDFLFWSSSDFLFSASVGLTCIFSTMRVLGLALFWVSSLSLIWVNFVNKGDISWCSGEVWACRGGDSFTGLVFGLNGFCCFPGETRRHLVSRDCGDTTRNDSVIGESLSELFCSSSAAAAAIADILEVTERFLFKRGIRATPVGTCLRPRCSISEAEWIGLNCGDSEGIGACVTTETWSGRTSDSRGRFVEIIVFEAMGNWCNSRSWKWVQSLGR